MAGLSIGFVEMTKNVLGMTTGLKVFTAETGLNTGALQQWQQVAERVGLSGDVATQAISRISQLLGGLKAGYGDPQALGALGRLGVNLSGSAYDVMNSLQSASMKHKPEIASQMLAAAGLSPELLRLFSVSRGTREGIRPTMTSGDQAAMADLAQELAMFNREVMAEFVPILVKLEPAMKEFGQILMALLKVVGPTAVSGITSVVHEAADVQHGNYLKAAVWIPEHTLLGLLAGKAGEKVINYSVTQHIHSNGSAEEVGKHVKNALDREHTTATKMFNNQGNP
jgi:hypothetical protein